MVRKLLVWIHHSGSTAVSCLFLNRRLIVANTGDSRAIMCQFGKAKAITKDQTPDDPKERERYLILGLV